MGVGRKTILVVLVAAAHAGVVSADLMPVAGGGDFLCRPAQVREEAAVPLPGLSCPLQESLSALGLDLLAARFIPPDGADAASACENQPVHVLLTEGRGSFELCLFALMGLGICRSAPWVKKLHLGVIPDWYHTSGPFQIGHSHAMGPDCLGQPVICFVQPQGQAEGLSTQYHRGTIWPLLRRSQFTLTVLGARGPPLTS
jgi:hypothetical protein